MLIPYNDSPLAVSSGNKDFDSATHAYLAYMDGIPWWQPDLAGFRDHLFSNGNKDTTVQARISAVRSRYKALIKQRDLFYALVPAHLTGIADRKAAVDELIARIEHSLEVTVSVTKHQDRDDRGLLRLSSKQAEELLSAPGTETLIGLRDTLAIALMLCTGVREMELVQLTVDDLKGELNGERALLVRVGKGNKSRLIPYGEMDWCLTLADSYLQRTNINEGALLRSIHRSGQVVTGHGLTTRSIQLLLERYPVHVNGKALLVKPHDCRRTYARRQYEAGMELVAIQQNLGHSDVKTTLGYIGSLDAKARRGISTYRLNGY